jgi:hypothetical protein
MYMETVSDVEKLSDVVVSTIVLGKPVQVAAVDCT